MALGALEEHATLTVASAPRRRFLQVTKSIDEIIRQRIKDGVFDDVVRKAALRPAAYRPKAAELSTEKSKHGLGEEYAKEYEQSVLGHESEESKETQQAHAAVRELLGKLNQRLDALC